MWLERSSHVTNSGVPVEANYENTENTLDSLETKKCSFQQKIAKTLAVRKRSLNARAEQQHKHSIVSRYFLCYLYLIIGFK